MKFESKDEPNFADAARILGVPAVAIDSKFGIVLIDPDSFLYTVRVDEAAIEEAALGDTAHGPFSDPKIAPFVWKP